MISAIPHLQVSRERPAYLMSHTMSRSASPCPLKLWFNSSQLSINSLLDRLFVSWNELSCLYHDTPSFGSLLRRLSHPTNQPIYLRNSCTKVTHPILQSEYVSCCLLRYNKPFNALHKKRNNSSTLLHLYHQIYLSPSFGTCPSRLLQVFVRIWPLLSVLNCLCL
jgi:hypothetical protein